MKLVNRTARLPKYVFSHLDDIKEKLKKEGVDVIDLGIGDPDLPTPDFIVNSAIDEIKNSKNHGYPPYSGIIEFKEAVAEYYKRKYSVELDVDSEIAALIGSKEGIAHLFLALTDNNDEIFIPDPGYPVYYAAGVIAGCNINRMYLKAEDQYLPQLNNLYPEIVKKAKMLIVNYPNNPTGAVASYDFYKRLIEFGKENNITVVNDGAYLDIHREDIKPISLMQIPDARATSVEFGTLSKSYNMAGWRLGYVVGAAKIISKLMEVKTNFDSGQFSAIQRAGAVALKNGDLEITEINKVYSKRRTIATDGLKKLGIEYYNSLGTFYIWFRVPKPFKSEEFAARLLEKAGVIVTPGCTFGTLGEGYCRISLTVSEEKLIEAINRIINIDFI